MEFILLYPNQIHHSYVGVTTIKSLFKHINTTKTFQNCKDKIENSQKRHPGKVALVTYLSKITKVSQQWIEEKEEKSLQINIQNKINKAQIMSIG